MILRWYFEIAGLSETSALRASEGYFFSKRAAASEVSLTLRSKGSFAAGEAQSFAEQSEVSRSSLLRLDF